jgi:signal transduction histidine kinase
VLVILMLACSYTVYQIMVKQTEESLGRGLEVTLKGSARILKTEFESAWIASHGAVTRPFLISALQQLSINPNSSSALQFLKKNIDSLPEAGFSAAAIYDTSHKELLNVGHFVKNLDTSLTLNSAIDNGGALIFDSSNGKLYMRIEEPVLNADGHKIGTLMTERSLRELSRSILELRAIGNSGELMLCEPLASNRLEMMCLLSRSDGLEYKQLKRSISGNPLPMSKALNGETGLISTKDYRQIPVVAAYKSISEHDLGLVLKIDEEELYKSSSKMLIDLVIYLPALIMVGCIFLFWFVYPIAKKITESEKSLGLANSKLEQSESHLRRLIGYQEGVREEERRRIAGDIHDQLGGDLTGISSHLSVAISSNSKLGLMPNKNLESALSIVSGAMKTVRMTINELRLPMLDNFGIWAALRWYSSEIEDRSELSCEFVIDQLSELTEIDPDLTTAIFRIVQEATTNVIRHANASMVTIQVRVRDGELIVEVLDDGTGMATDQSSKLNSMGLAGMRERARYLGGRLDVTSILGEGTRVALFIPLSGGGGVTLPS